MNDIKSKKRGSRRRKKTKTAYTTGEMNRLIDSIVHPICETDKRFILLDGFLHALIEQNPPATVRKFIKYNLPDILKQLGEGHKSQ